ncbi:hypothetical protein GQ457_07G006810 [Hibiscus cannabinus]
MIIGFGEIWWFVFVVAKLNPKLRSLMPIIVLTIEREVRLSFCGELVKALRDRGSGVDEIAKFYQIAYVLYDMLRSVVPASRVDNQTKSYAKEVDKKKEQFEHYNLLPLHAWVKPVIMELPEIKAALTAIQNLEGNILNTNCTALLTEHFLAVRSRPAKGNVANQREHLILLLANIDVRKKENFKDYCKNYRTWCNYLRCKSHLSFQRRCDRQQLKLIYVSLYLLISGEASNI